MPKKFWQKIITFLTIGAVVGGTIYFPNIKNYVNAAGCPDVKIIFARGSGAPRNDNADYQAFKTSIANKLALVDLSYEFEDLDYPAIGVGVDNIWVTLRTFFGGGDAYEFGDSVNAGVQKLTSIVNGGSCPNTKYVLGGYSQGAMVVSKALPDLKADRVIYAATFGDPKIYLPEGKGAYPDACRGANLSNYRTYVPDCYAYEGLLGSYRPYQTEAFIDKLGTWCDRQDIMCSSYRSISNHVSYVADDLYEDASKMIFAKITAAFDVQNNYISEHDTAILIDSTGSMSSLIAQYKAEALRLAEATLASGGRVALYDYRDLNDPYQPVEHCNFETCTLDIFIEELGKINADGGGDNPESLLSASFKMMNKLQWKAGSTKSVVVLTDNGYHSPDIDGIQFADVVALSKRIDPVNFYIITPDEMMDYYYELAEATGGAVVNSADDLSVLTDTILARFDSLPRVEEIAEDESEVLPKLAVTAVEDNLDGTVTIRFENTGSLAVVILNDAVLGVSGAGEIILDGLDRGATNILTLVPLSETRRGAGTRVEIGTTLIPRAPDTGTIK